MKKKVLFICNVNSCRSQMAEGLAKHFLGDILDVRSGGIRPSFVNPLAIKVMNEIGIDISRYQSKSMDIFINEEFDYAITLCDEKNAQGVCPFFSGKVKERLLWPFPDPIGVKGSKEEILEVYHKLRDDIKKKILDFFSGNK